VQLKVASCADREHLLLVGHNFTERKKMRRAAFTL
jgi:hypothetical protein